MDISNISQEIQNKLSGYTWIALEDLAEEDEVSMTVTIQDNESCMPQIEFCGYRLFSISKYKATVMRKVNKDVSMCHAKDLLEIAHIDCVNFVEIGSKMAIEKKNAYLE